MLRYLSFLYFHKYVLVLQSRVFFTVADTLEISSILDGFSKRRENDYPKINEKLGTPCRRVVVVSREVFFSPAVLQ